MNLSEVTMIEDAALPLDRFRAHLRLGTGLSEDSLQDGILAGFLRAAIAAIEGRTGKVLIARNFEFRARDWCSLVSMSLPLAPVSAVNRVAIIDAAGQETDLAPSRYRLEEDSQRPRLRPTGALFPTVPSGGGLRIEFRAGMAEDWMALPADLSQAVMLLAAHYYEYRNETALSDGCMPFGVSSLIQRYRQLRIAPERRA